MSLKLLANGLAKTNGLTVEQALDLVKQRQKDIACSDYFTAFVMDKIRQDEANAYKKHEYLKNNNKLKGEW